MRPLPRPPEPPAADETHETRIIYTCWPWGPWGGSFCGVVLVVVGGALVLAELFPDSPGTVWGLVLMALGAFVVLRGARGDAL